MKKISVNPTLFTSCRLCLEELAGKAGYQIVPSVNDEIMFCFGIEVQPYDGLPQIICMQCKDILCSFSEIKKKMIKKQDELRTQMLAAQSEHTVETAEDLENSILKVTRTSKRKPILYSSSDSEDEERKINGDCRETSSNSKKSELPPLSSYTKQFVCKICNSNWSNVHLVINHINRKHSYLLKKFGHILKKHCKVTIPKTDLGGTDLGLPDRVRYTKDKMVKSVTGNYYIIYVTKSGKKQNEENQECYDSKAETCPSKRWNSSGLSNETSTPKHKKRKRNSTESSNETLVLDMDSERHNGDKNDDEQQMAKDNGKVEDIQVCINIDSSGDETEETIKSNTNSESDSKPNEECNSKVASTIISNITVACVNKYMKKHYQDSFALKSVKNPTEIATKLKRKVLSIGRKIINKKIGVNCTPLVRFLENKNLDVSWSPRESFRVSSESNYIRVFPRMCDTGENFENESGWVDYYSLQSTLAVQNQGESSETLEACTSDTNELNNAAVSLSMPDIATLEANTQNTDVKKLLNANPVANPKQLPKKNAVIDNKNYIAHQTHVEILPHENNETCLPIIASSTSLAMPVSEPTDTNEPAEPISKIDKQRSSEAPRIKVKPVTELMSTETLKRMKNPSHVVLPNLALHTTNTNYGLQVFIPRVTAGITSMKTMSANNDDNMIVRERPLNETMILNTVELPNKKTNSPYTYLKNFLQLHNIILLDTQSKLSNEFHCLIKFKVMYNQDNKKPGVVLCLALYCSRNIFCLKISDKNQEVININNISAHWQWEVMKIFKGEVSDKLLNNAVKIGPDVYQYSKQFIFLLKSINLVQSVPTNSSNK